MAEKRYVVALTPRQARAVVQVSATFEEWNPRAKKGTTWQHFSDAGLAVDEAMGRQERAWESCENCDGSGWVEND